MNREPEQKLELQKVKRELVDAFQRLRNFVQHPPKNLVLGGGEGFINGARMALEKAQVYYDEIPEIQLWIAELASLEREALKMILNRCMEEFDMYAIDPSRMPEGVLFQTFSFLRDLRQCGEDIHGYLGKISSASRIMAQHYVQDFSRYPHYEAIPSAQLFMAVDLLVVLQDLGIDIQEYVREFETIIPEATLTATLQAKWKDHERVSSTYLALANPALQIRRNEQAHLLSAIEGHDEN